jgi:dTDP-glucose pyrophosphorylase
MYVWKNIILSYDREIQEAIEILDKESLRIVLVVDDSERLIGTVTDGDIRRGLIKNISLNSNIVEIMHREPTVALLGDKKESILSKMQSLDLLQIPIVDNDRKIVGLETIHNLLEKNKHDNPVFLMAGGFGKRLQPLTNYTPKPLLKVGSKPILENILEQFVSAGFQNFYISTHYKAEMVREHFGDGSNWDVSINYIHEVTPLGTAGALGLLPDNLQKIPIMMMNGDVLTKIDFEQLLNFHLEEGGEATVCTRPYNFQVPFGVIKTDGQHIISIEEKPIQKFFVNAGIYVLNPSILNIVDGKNHLDMPQLLEKILEDERQVNMFPVHENWIDIGQMEQFNQANKDSN